MSKTKIIILISIILVICGLGTTIGILNNKLEKTKNELLISTNNNKAYVLENDSLNNKNIQYQFTIDDLEYSNDSIIKILNKTRKDLKIKDKYIHELEYIASLSQKKDTVILKDTIFLNNTCIDTSLTDKWSSLSLHLEYPNIIAADYSFKNETVVATATKKVTVKPPKKCAFLRWFQKKQKIIEIEVKQLNPYCENKNYKSVKIIK